MKRKLTMIHDPGHGWLSVSLKDIRTLGIQKYISSFSYMNGTRAFLEEDCDAPIFIEAAVELAGWNVEVKQSYRENFNRSLGSFNSYWVENPIGIGSKVKLPNGRVDTIVSVWNNKRWVLGDSGCGVPKSNPFRYLDPPVQEAPNVCL